jgi:hypothetical protein
VVEFYIKLKVILRIITYLAYIIIFINKLYLHDLITGIAKRNRKYIKVN